MRTEIIPVGSVEKIDATIEAGAVLSGTVTVALVPSSGVEPAYVAAAWTGSDTDATTGIVSNYAQTTSAQTLAVGHYTVRVKFVNGTETVKRDCKYLKIIP